MKIGIVGKPSSGKSTFLNSACMTNAEMAAYPFTTIKPNVGTAFIRVKCACELLKKHCGNCSDGTRFVPVQLVDVAGLVPGAHTGKGMGNQFLSDAMVGNALIHVVDASGKTNAEGQPGKGDPEKDVKWLEEEIEFWMLGLLEKNWGALERKATMSGAKLKDIVYDQLSGLNITEEDVDTAIRETEFRGKPEELLDLVKAIRKNAKPIEVVANKADLVETTDVGIPTFAEGELALRKAVDAGLIKYSPGNNFFEIIGELSEQQKKAMDYVQKFLDKYGGTGVQQALEKVVFDVLGYIVVFPVEDENKLINNKGVVLPDAFLMPPESTALQLAYKVHSEIGDKFKGAIDCRTKRKIGRETILKHGDVIRIIV